MRLRDHRRGRAQHLRLPRRVDVRQGKLIKGQRKKGGPSSWPSTGLDFLTGWGGRASVAMCVCVRERERERERERRERECTVQSRTAIETLLLRLSLRPTPAQNKNALLRAGSRRQLKRSSNCNFNLTLFVRSASVAASVVASVAAFVCSRHKIIANEAFGCLARFMRLLSELS
jgi:hypothetical protein